MQYIRINGILFNNKNDDVLMHSTTWINLGNIILSKRNQKKWAKYGRIPFIGNVQKRQIYRDKKEISWGTLLWSSGKTLTLPTQEAQLIPGLGTKIPTCHRVQPQISRLVGIRGLGERGMGNLC